MMRILLCGATGRMGRAVTRLAEETEGVRVVGGIARSLGVSFANVEAEADVVMDFAAPAVLEEELLFCVQNGYPLVLASTGHDEAAQAMIDEAAERVAIFQSPNLSYGAQVLKKLVRLAGELLGDAYDVAIVETHHRAKKDAPSGTAKLLGEALPRQEVPMVSVRGGTVTGMHEVGFYGERDLIRLTHEALDRRLFAEGALEAAKWICGCAPGLYGMEDMLAGGARRKG